MIISYLEFLATVGAAFLGEGGGGTNPKGDKTAQGEYIVKK